MGCKGPSSLTPHPSVSGFTNVALSSDFFGSGGELVSGMVWFCARDPNSGPQAGKASHLPPEHLPSPNHSSLLLRKLLPVKSNYYGSLCKETHSFCIRISCLHLYDKMSSFPLIFPPSQENHMLVPCHYPHQLSGLPPN